MSEPTATAVGQTACRREAGQTVAAESGMPLENAGASVAEAGR
jgi:hypothetical protein